MKFVVTATVEYEPFPEDYDDRTPEKMLEVDLENLRAYPGEFWDYGNRVTFSGRVEES